MTAEFIFFCLAAICFLLVTFRVGSKRIELLGLGLLFFSMPWVIQTWPF